MDLLVRRLVSGTEDAHGNSSSTYGAPVAWTVRGLAPGSMAENLIDRNSSEVEWTVYADDSPQVPTEADIVVVDGDEFTVNGRPADWTRGPYPNPQAGVVVELRRVEG